MGIHLAKLLSVGHVRNLQDVSVEAYRGKSWMVGDARQVVAKLSVVLPQFITRGRNLRTTLAFILCGHSLTVGTGTPEIITQTHFSFE